MAAISVFDRAVAAHGATRWLSADHGLALDFSRSWASRTCRPLGATVARARVTSPDVE